jgi:integrase
MRAWNKLSPNFVRGVLRDRRKGRFSDGGHLYLQAVNGGASWTFQFERNGRERSMGLGSARVVSLALARELAQQCRELLAQNCDPIEHRKAVRAETRKAQLRRRTLRQCAEDYYAFNRGKWKNDKHAKQFLATLSTYAYPKLGSVAVNDIDLAMVVDVLTPILPTKRVTALRVRGRIEQVIQFAIASGFRADSQNPAAKDLLRHVLALRSEKEDVKHQPALPFTLIPPFMRALRALPGMGARCLELIVLTGMRVSAVRLARKAEFDLAKGTWTVPRARMKRYAEDFEIVLPERALAIVRSQMESGGECLFPGITASAINGKAIEHAFTAALDAAGITDHATVHGMRSAFLDWSTEVASFPLDVCKAALGHRIKEQVTRAYKRGTWSQRRAELLEAWDHYCGGQPSADVITLRA